MILSLHLMVSAFTYLKSINRVLISMSSTAQTIRKALVYILYCIIMFTVLSRSNSDYQIMNVSVSCLQGQGSLHYCAHCLRVPEYIHPDFRYKVTNEDTHQIARVNIQGCRNITCPEMIQLFEFAGRKPTLVDIPEATDFLKVIQADSNITRTSTPLSQSKQVVVITESVQKTFVNHLKVPYSKSQVNQQTGTIVLWITAITLGITLYVSIVKKCQFSFEVFVSACLTEILLAIHYNSFLNFKYTLAVAHISFIYYAFTQIKCVRSLRSTALVIGIIIWYLNINSYRNLVPLITLALNMTLVISIIFSDQGTVGQSQVVGCVGFVLFSGMFLGGRLIDTNVPFEVLGVVVIAWTIALLQMYSIDNVNFEMFEIQKGSQSIEEAVEEGEFENQEEETLGKTGDTTALQLR